MTPPPAITARNRRTAQHGPLRHPVACPVCHSCRPQRYLDLGETAIQRCGDCGCHYISPRADNATIMAQIQEWSRRDVADLHRRNDAFSPAMQQHHRRHLERIRHLLGGGQDHRLLDLGCATGAFLRSASQAGFHVLGIEVGHASAAYVRDHLRLPVLQGELATAPLADASMDVVTLFDVVEHLLDLDRTMTAAHRVLRPGGVLVLTTPNLEAVTARILGPRWWVINCPDEHIQFFTPATLGTFLRRYGFSPVETATSHLDVFTLIRGLRGRPTDWAAATANRHRARTYVPEAAWNGMRHTAGTLLQALFNHSLSPLRGRGERITAYARKT